MLALHLSAAIVLFGKSSNFFFSFSFLSVVEPGIQFLLLIYAYSRLQVWTLEIVH